VSANFDFIIVGSGINSLCCAALLAKKGMRVCVLERSDYFGGCIRTEELTLPGFRHDVLSGFHPLFVTSPSYAALATDLEKHGLEYTNTHKPTAAIGSSGVGVVLTQSRDENVATFNAISDGDGDSYAKTLDEMASDAPFIFSLLGTEPLRLSTAWLLIKELKGRGLSGLLRFFGDAMLSSRDWLGQHFRSRDIHALLAPWVLHTGLGPEANFSGAMNRVIAFSLESAGMPIVKGGSDKLVDAFIGIIESHGGVLWKNSEVTEVLVEAGVATGVSVSMLDENSRASSNQNLQANRAVICNVTPQKLYLELLHQRWVPPRVRREALSYQYGRACMQIHLALDELPSWLNPAMNDVAMVHICDGIDSVSKAVNEAERGLLPAEATIVVGQPSALDTSRAPDGKAILWLQLQELPRIVQGDALESICIPETGQWTVALREAYADRIVDRLCKYIPKLADITMARTVLSPADLEAMNVNLVGGDPYSGHCGIQQFFMWRPLKSLKNHQSTVKNLYHIGASTHPGPGLGGNSGHMVANLFN
jgi:phytoene dehydrogenase-like protein